MRYRPRMGEVFGNMALLAAVSCGGEPREALFHGGMRPVNLAIRPQEGTMRSNAKAEMPLDHSVTQPAISHLLQIPPRLQWNNAHGYCGETSIQAIGLYYGAWISQQLVRDLGGGEILLGVNSDAALQKLGFAFENWDFDHAQTPQFDDFVLWMKQHLLNDVPVIFGEFLADEEDSEDYDHIVPATGIRYQGAPDALHLDDTLVFANNFSKENYNLSFRDLKATRKSCNADLDDGGCIPQEVDFGVAVTGIVDRKQVSLPVRITVDFWDEPNISLGEAPRDMHASVLVSGLTRGRDYALLRFDDWSKVPHDGDAAAFLHADFAARFDFQATDTGWTYQDPTPFGSAGSVTYRVVALP